MGASNSDIGFGIHIAFSDDGSPEVLTNIAELKDTLSNAQSGDSVEVTHTDSEKFLNTAFSKEYKPGVGEPGEVTFPVNLVHSDATQDETTGVESLLLISKTWRIRDIPTATKDLQFRGHITNLGDEYPLQGVLVRNLTIKKEAPHTWVTAVPTP